MAAERTGASICAGPLKAAALGSARFGPAARSLAGGDLLSPSVGCTGGCTGGGGGNLRALQDETERARARAQEQAQGRQLLWELRGRKADACRLQHPSCRLDCAQTAPNGSSTATTAKAKAAKAAAEGALASSAPLLQQWRLQFGSWRRHCRACSALAVTRPLQAGCGALVVVVVGCNCNWRSQLLNLCSSSAP